MIKWCQVLWDTCFRAGGSWVKKGAALDKGGVGGGLILESVCPACFLYANVIFQERQASANHIAGGSFIGWLVSVFLKWA